MKSRILIGMVMALASGGCASLDFTPHSRTAKQVDMSGYFAERLQVGRKLLAAGHLTKAIETLRQASYDPATAPEAWNGMGVAYSLLGRDDVARQMFARAVDSQPFDERFQRNLARVDERIMLARNVEADRTAPAFLPQAALPASGLAATQAPVQVEPRRPVAARTLKMARAREIFITTMPDAGHPRTGGMDQRPKAPIRIALAPSRKAAIGLRPLTAVAAHPIRIALDPK